MAPSTYPPGPATDSPARDADRAGEAHLTLKRLAGGLKACQLYSVQHQRTTEAIALFLDQAARYVERHGPLAVNVARASFTLDFEERAREDPVVTPLVFSLDARGVKRFAILPGVTMGEVQHLLSALAMPLATVRGLGGVGQLLRNRDVQHIVLQEVAAPLAAAAVAPDAPVRAAPIGAVGRSDRQDEPPAVPETPEQATQFLDALLVRGASETVQDRADSAYHRLEEAERPILSALPRSRPALYRTIAAAIARAAGPEATALRALLVRRAGGDPLAAALVAATPPEMARLLLADASAADVSTAAAAELLERARARPQAPGDSGEFPVAAGPPAAPEHTDLADLDEGEIRLTALHGLVALLRVTRADSAGPLRVAIERELAYLSRRHDIDELERLLIGLGGAVREQESADGHVFLRKLLTRDVVMDFIERAPAEDSDATSEAWEFWQTLRDDLLPVVLQILAEEERPGARTTICRIVARVGRDLLPVITERLADPDWRVVRGIVDILGEIHDPGTVRHLGPLLQHSDLRVRQEAVRVLAEWETPDAIAVLGTALERGDLETRRIVVSRLGTVETPEARALLVRALEGHDAALQEFSVQHEIILALGQTGTPDAIPALEALVRAPFGFMSPRQRALRRAAEEAVQQIHARTQRAATSPEDP